jgi:hypothetical protein
MNINASATRLLTNPSRQTIQPLLLVAISAGLFVISLGRIDLRGMSDLGLIVVLPPEIYISLFLLTFSFIWTVHQPEEHTFLLLLHISLLIIALHGITVPLEEVPRFNVTWRHMGLVDYMLRNQSINPRIDAYFNWPAFFVLEAFVMQVMGLRDPIQLAFWPSAFNSLLYIGPLLLILRSVSDNRKLIWFALWLFYIANWIGQDYFAPQSLNFFLYITILGVLLWSFKGTQSVPWLERLLKSTHLRMELSETQEPRTPVRGRNTARRQRLIGLSVILLSMIFSVASHQLTPFAILISVAVLSLFNQISARGLGYILAIMIAVWMVYLAVAFMQNRTELLLANVGQVDEAISSNVTERLSGSTGHNIVVRVRLVETFFFWGLAFWGGFRHIKKNFLNLVPVLLACAPFTLLILQFYGGEMLLRIYFFTLPFMVFFVSGLIYTKFPQKYLRWQPWLAGLLSLVLISSFYISRYGNEKFDQFTAKEVEAVTYLYKIAEPGSLLAAPSPHYPIKFKGYELYPVRFYQDPVLSGDVNALVTAMEESKARASYFTVTTSQESFFYLFYKFPPEEMRKFEDKMVASGRFERIYSNEDARIYKLLPTP